VLRDCGGFPYSCRLGRRLPDLGMRCAIKADHCGCRPPMLVADQSEQDGPARRLGDVPGLSAAKPIAPPRWQASVDRAGVPIRPCEPAPRNYDWFLASPATKSERPSSESSSAVILFSTQRYSRRCNSSKGSTCLRCSRQPGPSVSTTRKPRRPSSTRADELPVPAIPVTHIFDTYTTLVRRPSTAARRRVGSQSSAHL
jgi:hypothetical protein